MKRDAGAVALKWFEENMPFDNNRDKELLVSFSTGFTSTGDDSVNAERAAEVGMEMQIKLDGQSVTLSMDVKSKVNATQKDSYGQRAEDSSWLSEVVQLTDHFCRAGNDSWDKLTVCADSLPIIPVQ